MQHLYDLWGYYYYGTKVYNNKSGYYDVYGLEFNESFLQLIPGSTPMKIETPTKDHIQTIINCNSTKVENGSQALYTSEKKQDIVINSKNVEYIARDKKSFVAKIDGVINLLSEFSGAAINPIILGLKKLQLQLETDGRIETDSHSFKLILKRNEEYIFIVFNSQIQRDISILQSIKQSNDVV